MGHVIAGDIDRIHLLKTRLEPGTGFEQIGVKHELFVRLAVVISVEITEKADCPLAINCQMLFGSATPLLAEDAV